MLNFATPLILQTFISSNRTFPATSGRPSQFHLRNTIRNRPRVNLSRSPVHASVATPRVEGLSEETISTVKSTVPVLQKNAIEIGLKFYETLFERYPAFKKQFNIDRQAGGVTKDGRAPAQVTALTNSIVAFGKNIDNMDKLKSPMERIYHKHVSRGVTPDQYAAIGECFLFATKSVLGDVASDEVMEAWTEAFGALAQVYITNEDALQKELEDKAGYSGFVDMRVAAMEDDGKNGKRLSLVPNEVGIPTHSAGQYISIFVEKEGALATMTSMKIVDSEKDKLWIHVPDSKEKASRYLLDDVQVETVLQVSVPVGRS